ncbi:MAG: SIMPL domain-containing protein [Actinomycetota bacterium]
MSSVEQVGEVVPALSVGASAVVEAAPDEARLTVNLTADGRSSNGALEAIRKRLDAMDDICEHFEVPATDRASTVSVTEQRERDGGRWLSKGYRATATLRLVIRSTDTVGPLVNAAVEEAGPAINGPHWRVSPKHPAWIEACAEAGRQAGAKAAAYAEALGVELGAVVSVAEPGVDVTAVRRSSRSMAPPSPATMAAYAAGAESVADEPVIDLHPGTQEVHATVNVTFRVVE